MTATAADLRSLWVILRSWNADPLVVGGLVLAAVAYWAAMRRARAEGRRSPRVREALFASGLVAIALALLSPIDAYSNLLLSVHMVQHLLLTMVAPPLLLLGAPVSAALRAVGPRARRSVLVPLLRGRAGRLLGNPILSWSAFVLVLWGTHFSAIYELTLRNQSVHVAEHVAYLGTALLFWAPIVSRDPIPARIGHPARILYVFLAMPQVAFLGVAIAGAGHVLYPAYVAASARLGVSALADQHLAGSIMWETGAVLMLPALTLVLADWFASEEHRAAAEDAALERAHGASGLPPTVV